MRFFSNDAKETHDEETDRLDDAAAVPQQRTGSPWSDTRTDDTDVDNSDVTDKSEVSDEHVDPELLDGEPADARAAGPDDRETVDGEVVDGEPVDGEPVDGEPVAEGGHNALDLGGPDSATDDHDDLDLPLDEQPANSTGTRDEPFVNESTVTSPGAPVNEPTDTEITGTDEDPAIRDEDSAVRGDDPAISDGGDFDEPHTVDPATGKTLDTPAGETGTGTDETDDDEATATEVDAPVAVTPVAVPVDEDGDTTTYAGSTADEPVLADKPVLADGAAFTDETAFTDGTAGDTTAGSTDEVAAGQVPAEDTAVVAAVPVAVVAGGAGAVASAGDGASDGAVASDGAGTTAADSDAPAKPGTVEEKSVERFFGADAATTFQERWRDVQLRFVDSPKDATAEAAGLVDEAVDQLTASLKSQKDGLLGDSDDTEKLRMELRGYRDILNKVLSL